MPVAPDTLNRWLVSLQGDAVVLLGRRPSHMTPAEALTLAAYLVIEAEAADLIAGGGLLPHSFAEVLAAVRNT